MTSTGDDIGQKPLWTSEQVRRAIILQAIIGLIITVMTGFGTYWYTSYQDVAKRIDVPLTQYQKSQSVWVELSRGIFSDANPNLSTDPHLPTVEDVKSIQVATTNLMSKLNAIPTPTGGIEKASIEYRRKLNDIILEIGRYDETAESTVSIIRASNQATEAGETHRYEIEKYLGSTLNRLLGSL